MSEFEPDGIILDPTDRTFDARTLSEPKLDDIPEAWQEMAANLRPAA